MNPGLAGVLVTLLDRAVDDLGDDELNQIEWLRNEADMMASHLAVTAGGLAAMTDHDQAAKEFAGCEALSHTFYLINHVAESISAMLQAAEMAENVKLRRARLAEANASPARRARPVKVAGQGVTVAQGVAS